MHFGLVLQWTLEEYRRECAGLMHMKRFDAMAVDDKKLVIYDCNCLERDTALGL